MHYEATGEKAQKCDKITQSVTLMRGVYRFNIVWNVTIDRICVSAEIAPKIFGCMVDKIYIFG